MRRNMLQGNKYHSPCIRVHRLSLKAKQSTKLSSTLNRHHQEESHRSIYMSPCLDAEEGVVYVCLEISTRSSSRHTLPNSYGFKIQGWKPWTDIQNSGGRKTKKACCEIVDVVYVWLRSLSKGHIHSGKRMREEK